MRPRQVKTLAPEDLTREQKKQIVQWVVEQARGSDGYAYRYWTGLYQKRRTELRYEVERCLDWHRSKGSRHADWVAAIRNWLRIACRTYMKHHSVQVGVE